MLTRQDIVYWLREKDPVRLEELWQESDRVRKDHVGDEVHLRGIIEISNHCLRGCHYCGINKNNRQLERYLLSHEEIMSCVHRIGTAGFGTVVLQAGEHPAIAGSWIAKLIRQIKEQTNLAITLSLGERSRRDLLLWKESGADRYLLKFETADSHLYRQIHPPIENGWTDRFEVLQFLQKIKYETGSGFMIGIPGQTIDGLAGDILRCAELYPDMIAAGPFIPHHATPLGNRVSAGTKTADQVEPDTLMSCKVIALLRMLCPDANIPSTSSLSTIDLKEGRELGLMRGANIFMPNMTPQPYRQMYDIYPGRAVGNGDEPDFAQIHDLLGRLKRRPGTGPGSSKHFTNRLSNN